MRVRYLTPPQCAKRLNDGYKAIYGLDSLDAFNAGYIRGEIRDGHLVAAIRQEKDGVQRHRDFYGVIEPDWAAYLRAWHPRLAESLPRAS